MSCKIPQVAYTPDGQDYFEQIIILAQKNKFTVVKPGGALAIDIFGVCWFSDVSGFDGKIGKIPYKNIMHLI